MNRKTICVKAIVLLFVTLAITGCNLFDVSGSGNQISTPQNIEYRDGIIYWNAVENASGYRLCINGSYYSTSACQFDLSTIFFADTSFSYSITAIAASKEYRDSNPTMTGTAKYIEGRKEIYSVEFRNYGLGRTVNLIAGSYLSIYTKGADVFNRNLLYEKEVSIIRLLRNKQIIQSGDSLESFQEKEAANFGVKISVHSVIDDIKNLFFPWQQSSIVDVNLNNGYERFNSKDTRYQFYTIANKWEAVEYSFDGWSGWTDSELDSLLSDSFKADAMKVQNGTMSAASFVNKYGTHIIMGCIMGASLNVNYSMVGIEEEVENQKRNGIERAFTVPIDPNSIVSLHFEESASWIKTSLKGSSTLNTNSEFYSIGGNSPFHYIMGETFDFEAFSTAYSEWAKSISDKSTYGLVDIVDGSLVCIWDILGGEYEQAKVKLNQYLADCLVDSYNVAKGKIDDLVDENAPRFEDGSEKHPWRIGDIVTLKEKLEEYNSRTENNYLLTNDIDLAGTTWFFSDDFKGILDGKKELGEGNYVIRNLNISSNRYTSGFFNSCSGTVRNITFENCIISNSVTGGDSITGIIAGQLTGNIMNCSVINSTVISTASDNDNTENSSRWSIAGGIVGRMSGGSIKNCSVSEISITATSNKHDKAWSTGWNEAAYVYAGGLVGEITSGTVSGNHILSIAKMQGNAQYRTNTFWPVTAGAYSRICLGGVVGRQSTGSVLYSSNYTVSSLSPFAYDFNSYNDTYAVDKHEDEYLNVGIALSN